MAERTDPGAKAAGVLGAGAVAGLAAGLLFAVVQMIVLGVTTGSPMRPWALFASVLVGPAALSGLTFGFFFAGVLLHFALSALFGAGWALVAKAAAPDVRDNWGVHTGLAAVYGFALWLVNFQVIARLAFPWFLETHHLSQVLMHMFAFGVPLGVFLAARFRALDLGARRRAVA